MTSTVKDYLAPAASGARGTNKLTRRERWVSRRFLALDDFEAQARRVLPRPIYHYIAGAAERGQSLADNREAFADYAFVPRVLQDTSQRSAAVELFGHRYAAPFGVAPMGVASLSSYLGDHALAAAASAHALPYVLSATSLTPMEQLLKATPDRWFQAYLPGDEETIEALLARVATTGCQTLVVTVDLPVGANRENNVRHGFSMPLRPSFPLLWQGIAHPRWSVQTLLKTLLRHGMPHFENATAMRGAPLIARNAMRDFSARDRFQWSHIEYIRRHWRGQLVIKGLLSTADARRARDAGANGIVLSNHGGRQLDGAISPLRVLQEIVAAVPELVVMIDGGVRRGSDVLKAIALGARFVFIGRPFNFALAAAGELGVNHAMALLKAEIERNMAMLGVTQLSELNADFVAKIHQYQKA